MAIRQTIAATVVSTLAVTWGIFFVEGIVRGATMSPFEGCSDFFGAIQGVCKELKHKNYNSEDFAKAISGIWEYDFSSDKFKEHPFTTLFRDFPADVGATVSLLFRAAKAPAKIKISASISDLKNNCNIC